LSGLKSNAGGGVVRVSIAHDNTRHEIERLTAALEEVLS